MSQVVKRKPGRQVPSSTTPGQTAPNDKSEIDLPNPLTVRAVGAIFQRRWAVPMTVALVCLLFHAFGSLFDSTPKESSNNPLFDFRSRIALPLSYSKYGVGAGAIFGSAMWLLVVTLSDDAEGKTSGPSEHWAQNNSILLVVLLGLGMATGGILAFAFAAMLDILKISQL